MRLRSLPADFHPTQSRTRQCNWVCQSKRLSHPPHRDCIVKRNWSYFFCVPLSWFLIDPYIEPAHFHSICHSRRDVLVHLKVQPAYSHSKCHSWRDVHVRLTVQQAYCHSKCHSWRDVHVRLTVQTAQFHSEFHSRRDVLVNLTVQPILCVPFLLIGYSIQRQRQQIEKQQQLV